MEIVYQGVDEKTLNYVDAIVRSVSLDESDYDTEDDNNANETVATTMTTTTTAETTTTNAKKELENAFKIHAAWSARLNAILETLSDADLEDEMESLIQTADEQRRRKQNNNDDVTAFLPAALRYKQNHIRFLSKGCEVVQSYIDWLDDDDDDDDE